MKKSLLLAAVAALLLLIPRFGFCAESNTGPLKAAIFVQNLAGMGLDGQVDSLSKELAVSLTEKGFSILDRRDVISKFSDSHDRNAEDIKASKALEQLSATGKADARLEDALSGSTAVRIAQMLRVNYLVAVSIQSYGNEVRAFTGQGTAYGTNNQSVVSSLRLAVRVLDSAQGGTIYGDVVTVSDRTAVGEHLTIVNQNVVPGLIEAASVKIAGNISNKLDEIRNVKVSPQEQVTFTVKSNIDAATVELDGVVVGSTPGTFKAAPGIHQLRVSKEWLANWERMVNIVPNQAISVALELSEDGIKKYMTLENFKAQIEIEKKLAEGEKKHLENSYEKIQGAPTIKIHTR